MTGNYRGIQRRGEREREREGESACNNCCMRTYIYSHVRHLHGHTSRSDSARRVFDMFSVIAKCPLCAHADMTGIHTSQRNGNGPVGGHCKTNKSWKDAIAKRRFFFDAQSQSKWQYNLVNLVFQSVCIFNYKRLLRKRGSKCPFYSWKHSLSQSHK